jgi:hypothetical protein
MGTYRIWVQGGIGSYWVYFDYRTTNGVMEAKQRNNNFAKWTVIGSIPSGAELV